MKQILGIVIFLIVGITNVKAAPTAPYLNPIQISSGSKNYTVSWNYQLENIPGFEFYRYEIKDFTRNTTSYVYNYNTKSKVFTNQPNGTYIYKVRVVYFRERIFPDDDIPPQRSSAIVLRYSTYSNSQSVTVNAVSPIVNNTICCSQTIAQNTAPSRLNGSLPSGGNGTFTYQWQQSANEVTWSNVSGATGINYQPPSLSQTMCYRRVVRSGTATPSTSEMVIIHVTTPGIGNNSICCSQTVQSGVRPALISGSQPTGGSGSYTYQWQKRVNGGSWTNMSGATNKNMQPPILTQTTDYRRTVNSSGASTSYSNVVTITVIGPLSASITGPHALRQGRSGTFTANATGGNGVYTYQWRYRYDGVGSWSGIVGTNATYRRGMGTRDFELQLKVTSNGQVIVTTHYVYFLDIIIPPYEFTPIAKTNEEKKQVEPNGLENFSIVSAPNPFNTTANIKYILPEKALINAQLYNELGQFVSTIENGQKEPGTYQSQILGNNLKSGLYILKFTATYTSGKTELKTIKINKH